VLLAHYSLSTNV